MRKQRTMYVFQWKEQHYKVIADNQDKARSFLEKLLDTKEYIPFSYATSVYVV